MTIFLWHNLRLLSLEHLGQIQIPLPWWLCRQCWVHGIKIQWVESTWGECFVLVNKASCSQIRTTCPLAFILICSWESLNSSELAQRVGINEIAESMMAFNTNYKDTGLFGVYAVAKVRSLPTLNKYLFFICRKFSSLPMSMVLFCAIYFFFLLEKLNLKNWILILIEFYYVLYCF